MTARTVTRAELDTPLLPYGEARTKILKAFRPLPAFELPLGAALGLATAGPVVADRDVPGFDGSAMDGYAVVAADTEGASPLRPVILPLAQDLPAGSTPTLPLKPGTVAKIMTGAPLPPGGDAVVPWEEAQPREGAVAILVPTPPGRHVRKRGEHLRAGREVVREGTVLAPPHLGLLASLGRSRVLAHPRPQVAILSTGDELVPPGSPIGPGRVYDANSVLLGAVCRAAGARVDRQALSEDDPDAIAAWLLEAAHEVDLIVTSAGVSVGEHDWVRVAIERIGRLDTWRVAVKPGKPLAFGRVEETPVLALPGNPESAFAVAKLFLEPAIRIMTGRNPDPPSRELRLAAPVPGDAHRLLLCPVRIERGSAIPVGTAPHATLAHFAGSDGIALVPPGGLPQGATVHVDLLEA